MSKCRQLKHETGFTLIEVVVAAAILAIVLVPLLGFINRGAILSQQAQDRTIAMGLAQEQLEYIKAQMPRNASDFQPPADLSTATTLQTIFTHTTSPDNPELINQILPGQTITKTFKRYATYTSSSTTCTPYTYYDLIVTITVRWNESQWGRTSPQDITLTSEITGR